MKAVIYNDRQLGCIIKDVYQKFNEFGGQLSIEYNKPYKDKTKNQLGFIFGALIDSIQEYFKNNGERWTKKEIKNELYYLCSKYDERFVEQIRHLDGKTEHQIISLSEMDREMTACFIDRCLWLIDNLDCFNGLILHPSIRYTWIRHIEQDDIDQLRMVNFPRVDKEYISFEHSEPCFWCGKMTDIQVHHLKELGYTGTAYKADDWLSVPLCQDCHLAYHTNGKQAFEDGIEWITKYINIVDFCKLRYNRWKNKL